jgi:tetratricopeptide (TPR) repeat protein
MNKQMKRYALLLSILSLVLFSNALLAQEKELKKAEDLYDTHQYNAAIPYYEAYLKLESRVKILSVKTRLAYCYRMANKSAKAEELYAQIIEDPKVRPEAFFFYGEMLMANGKYEEAKAYFKKYLEIKPEDEKTIDLLAACDKVKSIQQQFIDIEVNSLSINTSADDFSPIFYEDGIAFLSDQGEKGATYGWTGRSYLRLFKTVGGSNGNFQEIEEFSRKINEKDKNTGPVTITRDGQTMIITRNAYEPSVKNTFNLQLFELQKKGDEWGRGEVMPFCKVDRNYMHPTLTPSGDTLFFVTDMGGGAGGTDIYMTYRTPKGWKQPINLVEINTPGHEAFPFIHPDGTLYFASKGHSGFGGFDIFKATIKDGVYSKVINLGMPINSPKDDTGFIMSRDKKEGYFASSRKEGNDDIYYFVVPTVAMKGEDIVNSSPKTGEQMMGSSRQSIVAEKPTYDSSPKAAVQAENENNASATSVVVVLEGKIVDEATQIALSNAIVYVEDENGKRLQTVNADANGKATADLEMNKNYSIVIEKAGYRTKSLYITTNSNNKKLTPTFSLVKK